MTEPDAARKPDHCYSCRLASRTVWALRAEGHPIDSAIEYRQVEAHYETGGIDVMTYAARSIAIFLDEQMTSGDLDCSDTFEEDLRTYIVQREARLIERCCDEVQNAMGQAGSWQRSGWGVMEQIRAIKPEAI